MSQRDPKNTPAVVATAQPEAPWWRHGMVWLVVGGPLAVVIASIGTAVVAVRGQDPVLPEYEAPTRIQAAERVQPTTPAMTARNHAATNGQ